MGRSSVLPHLTVLAPPLPIPNRLQYVEAHLPLSGKTVRVILNAPNPNLPPVEPPPSYIITSNGEIVLKDDHLELQWENIKRFRQFMAIVQKLPTASLQNEYILKWRDKRNPESIRYLLEHGEWPITQMSADGVLIPSELQS